MTPITKADVWRVAARLRERGLLADDRPRADGSRTAEQWLAAIRRDAAIAVECLALTLCSPVDQEDKVAALRTALREARRMESDIYRFAREIHGLSSKEVQHG